MIKLKTFNAHGMLTISADRITGHLVAIQEDGRAIEVIQDIQAIEGGIAGVSLLEQRIILVSAMITAEGKPDIGILTIGSPSLSANEPHIKAAIRDLLRAMEDRL